ncbi:VOC family protein [Klenkia sp. LSe6-5]|uniref:VOC family protein n=1 Tax=Klenkia sesuvii TaxID=3103137 RepID=A0ABU8DXQ5_9ACTN
MAARITSVVVNCSDPAALAGFWARVLGWEVQDADDDLVTSAPA